MTRRTYKSELKSLIFTLENKNEVNNNIKGPDIIEDIKYVKSEQSGEEKKKFLIWGFLIGRSVDQFTDLFLVEKRNNITNPNENTFHKRINVIFGRGLCSKSYIKNQLKDVKGMRNDLFHTPNRHFNSTEIRKFIFKSLKCMTELCSDLP